jgi:hypothetical protein
VNGAVDPTDNGLGTYYTGRALFFSLRPSRISNHPFIGNRAYVFQLHGSRALGISFSHHCYSVHCASNPEGSNELWSIAVPALLGLVTVVVWLPSVEHSTGAFHGGGDPVSFHGRK